MLPKNSSLPSWGLLLWGVISLAGCTRVGFPAPHQGDSDGGADADARITDAQGTDTIGDSGDANHDVGVPGSLVATPAAIEDRWVEVGTTRHYVVAITTMGTCVPNALQIASSAPWITAQVVGTFAPKVFRLDITVDATHRLVGDAKETLAIAVPTGTCRPSPTAVALTFRILKLQQIHVGPSADTCPHETAPTVTTSACDYTGTHGLRQAVAASNGHVHIHLHDNKGATATYSANIDIKGQTWISAAETSNPDRVVLRRGSYVSEDRGILRLAGDDCYISRLTLLCDPGADWGIITWRNPQPSSETATTHHLIDAVWFRALAPEKMGSNSIRGPFQLGSDTTVRNCHIEGFFDSRLILNGAKRTRLIQNSFIIYQRWGLGIDVTDTQDVVIANNTFIGLTHVMPALMTADAKTQHLTVVGNVIEGAKTAVTGLPATGSHIVKDNVVGHADLESPYHPLFLTGTTQHASALVPGEGTSLDDLPVIGGPTWVPGALQKRSALTARRTVIRVGHGTCGTHTCDIDASAKNEIQQAVWSVWRGGTVEVYPSTQAYAGSAVIGWSITLRGMGNHPEDVVLRNEDELLVPSSYQLWRHGAVLTVLQNQDAKTTIENLSLDVIPGTTQHVKRGVILEYYPDAARTSDHVLRRVSIRSTSGTDNLEQAILLGSRTLTQDVLVQGPFQTCATFGPPYTLSNKYKTPESTAQIINFTCRLTGSDSQAPQAAFEVASVKNTLLANITVELKTPAPLFRAQRRFTGDTGAKALDLPKSFTLNAASVRGITTNFDGFAAGDGTYTLTNLHTLASGDAFFVSSTNSHLATGAQAIDTGVDPATLNSTLKAGTSLDGVIRKGRQIDRGAYEQGK